MSLFVNRQLFPLLVLVISHFVPRGPMIRDIKLGYRSCEIPI